MLGRIADVFGIALQQDSMGKRDDKQAESVVFPIVREQEKWARTDQTAGFRSMNGDAVRFGRHCPGKTRTVSLSMR